MSACLVTLWTIGRELSWHSSAAIAGRQAATSLSVAFIVAMLARLVFQS